MTFIGKQWFRDNFNIMVLSYLKSTYITKVVSAKEIATIFSDTTNIAGHTLADITFLSTAVEVIETSIDTTLTFKLAGTFPATDIDVCATEGLYLSFNPTVLASLAGSTQWGNTPKGRWGTSNVQLLDTGTSGEAGDQIKQVGELDFANKDRVDILSPDLLPASSITTVNKFIATVTITTIRA